jgi:hypothetical protein
MKKRTIIITILTFAVVVGATSCGDDDDSSADPPPASPTVTHPLADSDWVVTGVIEDDVAHPPPSDDLVIAFNGPDVIRVDLGCNDAGGAYVADQDGDGRSGSIAIADLAWTLMACVGVEDWSLPAEALAEATTWSISDDGDQLTIEGPLRTVTASWVGSNNSSGSGDSPVDPGEGVTSNE